ncbi:MAG TPA: MmcQ/YjbR family DNA-binding protein, partial [Burkholderiaceae bacterium]|nr:MmcQ/YjbR family DNA-binding protein [Burkholderiaceae bacterium]
RRRGAPMKIATVRRFALALPEAAEAPHFDYASFRVRGRIFATVPPGDAYLHVFVADEARDAALAMHPEFLEKLRWGAKIVGLRVTLADADAAVVKRLVAQAWRAKAPKALLAQAAPASE